MQCPPIRYATTSDGVKIAYWKLGSRHPQIRLEAPGCSHLELEWESPSLRESYAAATTDDRMLIRFDPRGAGLSDRAPGRYSIDHFALDIVAVADACGIKRFGLTAQMTASLLALATAAKHPERVAWTVAINTFPSTARWLSSPFVTGLKRMEDQGLFTAVDVEWLVYGGQAGRSANVTRIMETMIHEADPEARSALDALDIAHLLPTIKRPTMVVKVEDTIAIEERFCREVAAAVPGARYIKTTWESLLEDLRRVRSEAQAAAAATAAPVLKAPLVPLSGREQEILRLVAAGGTNQQIAVTLTISPNTVAKHVASILAKTGAANRTEAAAFVKGLR